MPRPWKFTNTAAAGLLYSAMTGCTAINGYAHLDGADQALARADEQNAKELAPYEYTLAKRYLEKAREEAGYSDWRACEDLAVLSAEGADKAVIAVATNRSAVKADVPAATPTPPTTPPPPGAVVVPPGTVAVPKPQPVPDVAVPPASPPAPATPPAPTLPAPPAPTLPAPGTQP